MFVFILKPLHCPSCRNTMTVDPYFMARFWYLLLDIKVVLESNKWKE